MFLQLECPLFDRFTNSNCLKIEDVFPRAQFIVRMFIIGYGLKQQVNLLSEAIPGSSNVQRPSVNVFENISNISDRQPAVADR